MGLPAILTLFHLVSNARQRGDRVDVEAQEKNPSREGGEGMDDDGEGEIDDGEEDEEPYDPLSDPARRLHRLASATNNTTFGSDVKNLSRSSSLGSQNESWFTKCKNYLLPPEESDAALDKFAPNYRWTPIISGVVVPFALLLEIPGLTEHWYIRTESNQVVETRENPVILDVGLALSMACGLFANICLMLRFLEKRVKTVTLLTMVFLTLHDLINIVAVIVFGVEHRFDDDFTYGQSFWMTVCSTAASTVTNVTLITDYIHTPDFAQSGSGLTRKQRSLVIIVMALLIYVAFGALVYSFMLSLNFIDGMYYTAVTIETIGFGDIHPDSTGSRVFTCCYMAFGILIVGVTVAMIRETVLEGLELGYRKRLANLQHKRREARRFRSWEKRWRRAIEWRLKEAGQPLWASDKNSHRDDVRFVGLGGTQEGAGEVHWMKRWLEAVGLRRHERSGLHVRGHPRGKHLNLDGLSPQQLEAAALEAGVPLEMFVLLPPNRPEASRLMSSSADNARHGEAHQHMLWSHPHPGTTSWPTESQTPTHAQVGRMSAMLTKFAMAVTGTHVHMLGHATETHPSMQMQQEARKQPMPDVVFRDPHRTHPDAETPEGSGSPDEKTDVSERKDYANGGQQAGLQTDDPTIRPSGGLVAEGTLHPNVPGWAKDLAGGRRTETSIFYANLKQDMEAEESKAYWAKLSVAWSIFLLFWLVGSAIFCTTEGWTYGDAMYFCFMAFTTTGYGDFAPATPTGRSVFVVWALMGVAAMTILISVIEEAGSYRYKSALHFKTFDNAVKKFRARENEETQNLVERTTPQAPRTHSNSSLPDVADSAQQTAQHELEKLPTEIIRQVRTFHDHMRFFVNNGASVEGTEGDVQKKQRIPKQLRKLLDEIAELEDIGERAKREILEDDDSRNTLLMLSIERTLRRLINSAERSLAALAERDSIVALQSQRFQGDAPEASTSTRRNTSPELSSSASAGSPTPSDEDGGMVQQMHNSFM